MRFVRTAENLFGLPAGFQRTEYLESTGTQYIDTGVLPVNNMEFDCKFTFTSLVSTNLTIVGSRDGEKRCQPIGAYNNKWSASIGGSYDANGTAVSANTPYIIKSTITNGQTITTKVNGSQASTCTSTTGLPSQELYIFARSFYGNTDPVDSKVNGRLYFLKIKANGVLVRDYIPCIDPLGVACMYDLVGKKPYYNAGSGTFTVGRQVIPVEYLESTGEQFIDTGITTEKGISTEAKFKLNQITSTSQVVFGKVGETSGTTTRYWFGAQGSTQKWYYAINNYITTSVNADSDIHTVLLDTVNNVCVLDGSTIATFDNLNPNNQTISLFGANYILGNNNPMSGRIYYAKIYDNDSLVRDFIPCKDENNVGFMFDKVSGTCYLNAGTGDFIVGENKYTSKLRLIRDAIRIPDGYTRVEYLESTGTQYIDTGVLPSEDLRTKIVQAFTGTDIARNSSILGSNGYNVNNRYWINYDRHFEIGYGNYLATDVVVQPNELNTIDFNYIKNGSHYFSFNGIEYTATGTPNTEYSIILFGRVVSTQAPVLAPQRIYKVQFIRNGVLVRSFIPVRDENNVGYMYDEVTGQIFGNAGSGSFVVGNDLPTAKVRFVQDVLPREYRPLKYLESTGTQWIDTGVKYNSSNSYKIENKIYYGSKNSQFQVQGWDAGGVNGMAGTGLFSDGSSIYGPSCENKSVITEQIINSGTNTQTITNYNIEGTTGSLSRAHASLPNYAANGGYGIFACYSETSFTYKASCRVYYYRIYQNGVLIRDFYPALRKSDNKPGMYDRITKQFYVNQGTGEFNYEI